MIKPRQAVIEMEAYNPPTSNREGSLRLDFNENTFGCSYNVIRSLRKIKQCTLSTYPEYTKLRKELAKYCNVKADEVIATNGTDEAIKTIIETYIEKGKDEIIIPVPTYAMLKFYAQLNEAVIKEITYNGDLSFPTEQILGAINNKTKIIVLVNPNNPTGTSINAKDVIKIIEKAKRCNSIVLIDEAYYQFCGKTSIPLIKKYNNLFITQTFSKAFGLAGLRLGYIISNKNNIKIIQKVISPYSVNIIAAICASTALKDTNYIKRYVTEIRTSKKILYKELNNLGIKYYKSDANFVLIKIGIKAAEFCKKLRKKGILVRNRSSDQLLDGCVRITLGTIIQTKQLIKEMQQVVKEINLLLIFDIDGVLVDVSKSYRLAIKKTVEYFTGRSTSFEEIQEYKNKGGLNNDWDLTEAIIKAKGESVDKKKIIKKFQNYYNNLINNEKWLLDRRILKSLSKRYTLAILTGRPRKEAYSVLKRSKITNCFSTMVAMEDITKQKPFPAGLLKILNQYPNLDAYYFGDTIDDMKTAISANIKSIGILPPQDKSAQLRNLLIKNGAKIVIKNINEIMEVLK
ncbi:histidinol-phosphate transaminase [Candidatus Woesearchaeota archaeon]|nr:histidinol-phosphate transaminase [Candidatus Woesearchaeota archaeon]